jgi:hypothetical protein
MRRTLWPVAILVATAACGGSAVTEQTTPATSPGQASANPVSYSVPLPDLTVYNPVSAGERLPDHYRPTLPRDAIHPVYDPSFVRASDVDWGDEILVIGIELEGEARAYPIGFLNRREIVVDNHRGIPTLVTW